MDDHQHQAAQEILMGADPAEGLCGLTSFAEGMISWWHTGSSREMRKEEYQPYFLLSHPELLDDFKPVPNISELEGASPQNYGYRVHCTNWQHHDDAIAHLNRLYRQHKADFQFEPMLKLTDPLNQYMLATGRTHFKGLDLSDLNPLYIALRAYNSGGADYADPAVDDDRIVLVGLTDGRGWLQFFNVSEIDEAELLSTVCKIIQKRDPDLLIGHELFKWTLRYLDARAKRRGVNLNLGRDGSPMATRLSRAPAAEKQLEYQRADVAGRHLVDTWFLTQYYDIVQRDLARFDAPYVARYLDHTCQLADPIPSWLVDDTYDKRPTALLADVKYELEATAIIFRTLIGSYFAQAQMLPLSLQDTIVRGNGMKINYLLLREYLRRGEAIPAPVEARGFVGGHTEIRQTGLIRKVLNVDIASLYPSIMLSHGVKPATDHGDVFLPLLRVLTQRRLEYKQQAKTAHDIVVRVRADARQSALKIFINSFFGYLGTGRMNWADPAQAEFITITGQEAVKQLAGLVEAEGGTVIEIDTDGVYFAAPESVQTPEQRAALVDRINKQLPAGITVELGGYFPAMLSHKVKNYALLADDGSIIIKGSGMKSRRLEPFLHSFIGGAIAAILQDQPGRVQHRFEQLKAAINGRHIDIQQLAKTDTLIESLDSYREKVEAGKRNRAAAYEIALKAKRPLRPGDQVSYYITGEKATVKAFEAAKPLRAFDPTNPDYNINYYLRKLNQNVAKVQGFLPQSSEPLFDERED